MEESHGGGNRRPRPRACATHCSDFLAVLAIVLVATLPSGAPLRDPDHGDIIGTTPFMDSLLFIITLFFLVAGHRLWHRGGNR